MEKEKKHCGDCKFLKYVDGEGLGFCDLLEECDVCVTDEACSEFVIESKSNEPLKTEDYVE